MADIIQQHIMLKEFNHQTRVNMPQGRSLVLQVRIPPGLWMSLVTIVSLRRADPSSRGILLRVCIIGCDQVQ